MKARLHFMKRRGFTIIEVVMVLAISALLLVGALGFIRNGDRRTFDDGMQTMLAQIREIQNEANSGIGPDPNLYNCNQISGNQYGAGTNSKGENLKACPFAPYSNGAASNLTTYLLGRSVSFGLTANFTTLSAGSQTLGTNYFTYTLGFRPQNSQSIFSIETAPIKHSTPPGIGFAGYCLNALPTACSGGSLDTSDAVTSVFGRASLSGADAAVLSATDGAQPLSTALTRNFPKCAGFSGATCITNYLAGNLHTGNCSTTTPDPTYYETYSNIVCTSSDVLESQSDLVLRFSDLKTGTDKAEIVINPADNSVSLLTQ